MTEPLVLRPGGGRVLDIFGTTLTIKATSSDSAGAYSLFEGTWEPGGFAPLPHVHRDQDESFYVLDGQFDFHVAGNSIRGTAGTFLLVPRGTVHSFVNAGAAPARLLFVHSPALEGFFLELARLPDSGPPSSEIVADLMRHWGMDVATTQKHGHCWAAGSGRRNPADEPRDR